MMTGTPKSTKKDHDDEGCQQQQEQESSSSSSSAAAPGMGSQQMRLQMQEDGDDDVSENDDTDEVKKNYPAQAQSVDYRRDHNDDDDDDDSGEEYSSHLLDHRRSRLHHDPEIGYASSLDDDAGFSSRGNSSHDDDGMGSSVYSRNLNDLSGDENGGHRGLVQGTANKKQLSFQMDDPETSDYLAPLPHIIGRDRSSTSRFGDSSTSGGGLSGGSSLTSTLMRSESKSTLMRGSIRISVTHGIDADGKGDGFRAQSAQIRNASDRLPHCRQRRMNRQSMTDIAVGPFRKTIYKNDPEQSLPTDKKGRPIKNNVGRLSSSERTTQYKITSIDVSYLLCSQTLCGVKPYPFLYGSSDLTLFSVPWGVDHV